MSVRTSYADLLRAFAAVPAAHDYVASLCGFASHEAPASPSTRIQPSETAGRGGLPPPKTRRKTSPTVDQTHGTLRILTPTTMEFRNSADKAATSWLPRTPPISPTQWRVPKHSQPTPSKSDLMPWSRLWPFIHRAQSRLSNGPKPALCPLVAALARLAPLRRVPYEPVWRWTRDSWILVDFRDALFPFHDDMTGLLKRWTRWVGAPACRAIACRSGQPPAALPPPATPVLYLGDFGMLDNRGDAATNVWDRQTAQSWTDYGRRLKRRGCTACALVPCPRQRWDRTLASVWTCADWNETAYPPPIDRGWTPLEAEQEPTSDALEQLLAMAAPALRVEMSLLRALRRLVHQGFGDPGLEYDFFHAGSRDLDVVVLAPETAVVARAGFRRLPPGTQRAIIDLLRRHHANCAEIVRAQETLLLEDCGAPVAVEEVQRAKDLVRAACAALLQHFQSNDRESIIRDGFANWQQCQIESFTESTVEEIAVAWKLLQKLIGEQAGERPDVIAGQDLLWLEAILKQPPERITTWELHRAGPDFRFDLARTVVAEQPVINRSSLVARFPACNPRLEIVRTSVDGSTTDDFELSRNGLLRNEGKLRRIDVRTDRAILGCDAREPPQWVTRFGRDRFGVFADFSVGAVTFPVRWIPPGEFEMGSPEDEPGRLGSEGPQHRVSIGRGFWLGETPVTQGQYAALTGQRPSQFKHAGDQAPVEQVSWEDCRTFCDKLTENLRELEAGWAFRLPSEAEWEYACRAGTTSALYTGPLTIEGDYNGPELDAIAWYGGNSGVDYEGGYDSSGWKGKQHEHERAGTHPVGQKRPNAWGLYDTLGNVWEWCEDAWQNNYDDAPTDGSAWAGGGRFRVCRGGGWAYLARDCHCACRYYWEPGFRIVELGFRLVLAVSVKEDIRPFS